MSGYWQSARTCKSCLFVSPDSSRGYHSSMCPLCGSGLPARPWYRNSVGRFRWGPTWYKPWTWLAHRWETR